MISYYNELNEYRQDSQELQDTIKETTSQLFKVKTTSDHPGVLLGKIQSGKTRAFIGIMATAFDEGIDVVVVLTKNSQLLGEQTTRRINN